MASDAEKENAKTGGYNVYLTNFGNEDAYAVYHNGVRLEGRYGSESDAWDDAVAKRWRDQNDRG